MIASDSAEQGDQFQSDLKKNASLALYLGFAAIYIDVILRQAKTGTYPSEAEQMEMNLSLYREISGLGAARLTPALTDGA